MLNYTIGAVRKKKSTAKKKTTTRKSTSSCSTAGYNLKVSKSKKAKSTAGGVLALCKASSSGFKVSPIALKKYGVRKSSLSKRK